MKFKDRPLPVIAIGLAVTWVLLAAMVVPWIIEAAFKGESSSYLNNVFQKRNHPLDYYLAKWFQVFWAVLLVILGVVLPLSFVRPVVFQRAWMEYWFRPTALWYLAVTRLVCVGFQLWVLVTKDHYNQNQLRELSSLPDSMYQPLPVVRLFLWPWGEGFRPSIEALYVIYGLTLAVGAMALIGFKTNWNLILFAAGLTFLQGYSYSFGDLHHPEALMIMSLWMLGLSPAGRALSVDLFLKSKRSVSRWVAGAREQSVYAAWPLLLVQSLFALVYLDAGIKKVWTAGLDWMNGYTLQYYLLSDSLRRGGEFGVWLGQQHGLAWVLSWFSVLFELTFFLVLIFPRLTWIYVPLGIAFHVGNCASSVACFYQFIALYIVFLPQLRGAWTESIFSNLWRRSRSTQTAQCKAT